MLRECGIMRVEVAGELGDSGIDGAGVLRMNLISFRGANSCRRYAGW